MALRIGDLLVQRGVISQEAVDLAAGEAQARGMPLLSYLLVSGMDESALVLALSERNHMPGLDLSRSTLALDAVGLVPRIVAETDTILPLSLDGGRLHLAMSQPLDERVVSEVRFVTGMEVSAYAAVKHALARVIGEAYDAHARGEVVWRGRDGPEAPRLAVVIPPAPDEVDETVVLAEEAEISEAPEADVAGSGAEPAGSAGPTLAVQIPAPAVGAGRPTALVVDDEPEIRQLVRRTLEAKGYAVELAVDGAQALDRAEELVPDVILLDAMLPRVHGFEACRRLKRSPRTRRIPVVMMTAVYRGWRFAQDAREHFGAEDYVEKPFRLDDLFRRVEAARRAGAAQPAGDSAAAEPLLRRARAMVDAGQLEAAGTVLAQAVRADPYAAEAHYLLGQVLRVRGDAFAAMTALEHAAELAPGHLAALRALAALYEEKGFRRKAAEALERGLASPLDATTRDALRREVLRLLA